MLCVSPIVIVSFVDVGISIVSGSVLGVEYVTVKHSCINAPQFEQ